MTPDVADNLRFAFGENWSRFIETLSDEQIEEATLDLQRALGDVSFVGARFLDIGSGSGLMSLAAHRLGAVVTSFDFDANSVACTRELWRAYGKSDPAWRISQGSALDAYFLESLGTFDVVYAWGVLHHTGNMELAIELATQRVSSDGRLFLAIYNDEGVASWVWTQVKKAYNRGGLVTRGLLLILAGIRLEAGPTLRVLLGRPVPWRARGMRPWRDLVDWVGGWPFEVASPQRIFSLVSPERFELIYLTTTPGHGCNEYIFRARAHEPNPTEPSAGT